MYLACVLEYLTAELLELSSDAARACKKRRIAPRHIETAVRTDGEMPKLLRRVTFPGSGVIPFVRSSLLRQQRRTARPAVLN